MTLRFALAAFLIVVGLALPLAAVAKRGMPWGYRGHQAVLVEVAGNVEITLSEDRRMREKREDARVPSVPGLFLDAGDEVRASRYAEGRIRLPAGDVAVGDGAQVVVGIAGKPGITLARGMLEVRLPSGTTPLDVKIDGVDAKLTLRPGNEGGTFRVLADGNGEVRALVKLGSAELSSSAGSELAEAGKLVVVGADKKPRVEALDTAALTLTVTCDGKKLTTMTSPGTQVFVAGNVLYPRDGKVTVDVHGGQVPVFARDVAGSSSLVMGLCDVKAKPAR